MNFPFGGLLLIVFGIVFLLNNFGILSWSIWAFLWKLWPVFLISWGLDLLLGKKFGSLINATLFIVVVGIIVIFIAQPNHPLLQRLNQKNNLWHEVEREDDFNWNFEREFRFD